MGFQRFFGFGGYYEKETIRTYYKRRKKRQHIKRIKTTFLVGSKGDNPRPVSSCAVTHIRFNCLFKFCFVYFLSWSHQI